MARVDLQSLSVLLFIWLITIFLLKSIFSKFRNKSNSPPSPTGLPIIGHLYLLGQFPHQAFHRLSKRYGPIFKINLGCMPAVVISSVETAERILKTQEAMVACRRQPGTLRHIIYGTVDLAFSPYGAYFKFLKKLCVSELLGARMLEQMLPVRQEETQRFLKFVLKKAQLGEPVDLRSELMTLINNVISRMTAGRTCITGAYADLPNVVREAVEITGTFDLSDFIAICKNLDLQGLKKRSDEVRNRFNEVMEKIIQEHEQEKKTSGDGAKDILTVLLQKSNDESVDIKLSREEIKAFVLGIFLAATDTTATTMEWILAELFNHSKALKRARDEIESVVGKNRLVKESDISKLPYLQAVIKEAFRLHPPVPLIIREFIEDCNIDGYDISKKTQMFINIWSIGRDPMYWEDPLEFRPERFMPLEGDKSWVDVRGQHFLLLPFGSGRRGCPGAGLALNVVYSTIALTIQCFDWKVGKGEENELLDMSEGRGLVLPKAQPLMAVPKIRLNPFPSID